MKTIGLICGGFSSEYAISVKSARNILKNLPDRFNRYLIFLRKDGWYIEVEGAEYPFDQRTFTAQISAEEIKIDMCIVYIHGDPGENGKVQAYLDMIGMPYVNSGALASELSFDKWYCNQFLKGFGINVAESIHLTSMNDLGNADEVVSNLGLPIFVKPCDSGSSYGIAKVKHAEDLSTSVQAAFDEGRTVVLESFLDGTEVTCGVYRNQKGVFALPVTEIVTSNDFFDYEAKYNGQSEEITPARISASEYELVQRTAERIYDLLQLRSVARIDFMLVGGIPYVIEVNTTPGFSDASIVPKMLEYAGISTAQFWSEIIETETAL